VFAEATMRAITAAQSTKLDALSTEAAQAATGAVRKTRHGRGWPKPPAAENNAPAGSARSLRSIRGRTRRRLHEPRPVLSPEARARSGQWRARVEAAQLAGMISKGAHLYLLGLLAIPSITRGDYSIRSDLETARRLNVRSVSTVRRHRAQAEKAGLIEVLSHGEDHKPCLVRPILEGNPVFQTGGCARLSHAILHANPLLTEEPKGSPPLSPMMPDAAEEGGRAVDRSEDQSAEPGTVPPKTAQVTVQDTPDQTLEAPAQPLPAEEPKSTKSAEPEPASETIQQPCGSANSGRVPFEDLWRLNPRGWIGRARTAWLRLSDAQTCAAKADLEAILWRGPLPEGFDYAATHFAMIHRGQPAAPILAPAATSVRVPEQVFIRENTPEWRCWQRHLVATKGKGTPVDSRGGWWFPSKLPPLTDAEVLPKGQAIRTNTCASKQA
jgi:hypothetical protein